MSKLSTASLAAGAAFAALAAPVSHAQGAGLETRMFVSERCASAKVLEKQKTGALASAVLGALAGPLVDAVVDLGVNAIAKAAEDKTVDLPGATHFGRYYVTGPTGLHDINPKQRCISVVTGYYGKTDAAATAPAPAWLNDTLTRVKDLEFSGLHGTPTLYFEAEMVYSDDRKHFALHPRVIWVGQFQQSSSWGRDKRTFDVALTFHDIENKTPYASFLFSYSGVEPGYARVSCDGQADAINYKECKTDAAGPTQGWFQMQPETTGMAKMATARQSRAARLGMLFTPPKELDIQVPSLTIENVDSAAAAAYCTRLAEVKTAKADEHCPADLFKKRELFRSDLAQRQENLDYVDAFILYQDNCVAAKPHNRLEIDSVKLRMTYYEKFPNNLPTAGIDRARIEACVEKAGEHFAGEFTLTAAVRETRPGSAFAKFFAPVAKSASGEVKTLLKAELPAARKAKEEQESAAAKTKAGLDRDALHAIMVLDLEVELAENAVLAADDATRLQKQILLLKKKYEANNAYRAAGLAPRYPGVT